MITVYQLLYQQLNILFPLSTNHKPHVEFNLFFDLSITGIIDLTILLMRHLDPFLRTFWTVIHYWVTGQQYIKCTPLKVNYKMGWQWKRNPNNQPNNY